MGGDEITFLWFLFSMKEIALTWLKWNRHGGPTLGRSPQIFTQIFRAGMNVIINNMCFSHSKTLKSTFLQPLRFITVTNGEVPD